MKIILTVISLFLMINGVYAITANELREKANQAVEQDEYDLAIEYHKQAISLEPNNANAYYIRGIFNLDNIDEEFAVIDFNKAIELGFDKIDIYYHRGLAYESLAEYENALNDLTIYIESKTQKTESDLFTAYKARGYCKKDLGDFESAIVDYSKALEINPNDRSAFYLRALIYMEAEQYDKSISEYNKLLKMFPKKEDVTRKYIILANLKADNFDEALNECNYLNKKNGKEITVYRLRVQAYLGLKKYQLALDDANAMLNDFPVHKRIIPKEEIYYYKAKANLGLKNYKVALNDINRSIEIEPQNPEYKETKIKIEKSINE